MIKVVLSGIDDCKSCYLFDFCNYMCEQGANLDYNVSPSNCRFFKDKSRIIELDNLKFTHIFMCEDGKLDSDTIFARIIDKTDDTVTLERYQQFVSVLSVATLGSLGYNKKTSKTQYIVSCNKCKCKVGSYSTRKSAIEAWNRRVKG